MKRARSLSDLALTLLPMGVSEESLTEWLAGEGFTVVDFGDGPWGYTDYEARTVGLRRGLRRFQRAPVLLHECWHVRLRHTGHQSAAVEAWIDEQVALTLIDPSEYAFWEREFGWNTGGLAHAMELPRWVVRAYRRVLARNLVEPNGLPNGLLSHF